MSGLGTARRLPLQLTFGLSSPANALMHSGDINDLSFPMEARHAPVLSSGGTYHHLGLPADVDYHIDNRRFLAYLKRKMLGLGCHWRDAEIDEVVCAPEGGAVDHLKTADGETLTFDLFVDCSGFASLLLGKALGAEWVSYSSSLKTDRAVIGTRPSTGDVLPYTTARTMDHGRLWNKPMQQEDHLGYVFCSAFCTDEQACAELREHCSTVDDARVIRFRTGRYNASWIGNAVAIGNAFAFIEPLESTAIHMNLIQVRSLTKWLRSGATPAQKESYNHSTNRHWDHLRWFIAVHYKFNRHLDTPFSQTCREQVNVSGVADYLEYFMQHGPLASNPKHPLHESMHRDSTLGVFSFDGVLAGCGVNRDFFRPGRGRLSAEWPMMVATHRSLAGRAMGHRDALRVLEEGQCDLLKNRQPHFL